MASFNSSAVIIPTHNRADLLRKVLDSVYAQTVKTDVYVMDDASTDATQAMVRNDYPLAVYQREEKSRGPTFQRNKGAALTQARILFTIDDDCVVKSPRAFEQTLEGFDHPRVGAVTIPYVNVLQDTRVRGGTTDRQPIQVISDYLAGMVAIRRDVYLAAGGYRDYLFMHVEESDLSIRIFNAGYVIRLGWADPLEHWESPVRDRPRLDILGARNHLLFSFYNTPWPQFPGHVCATTLLCLRHGIRIGHPIRILRGLSRGYAGMIHEHGKRAPVNHNVYRLFRTLKRRNPLPLSEIEPLLPPMKNFDGSAG